MIPSMPTTVRATNSKLSVTSVVKPGHIRSALTPRAAASKVALPFALALALFLCGGPSHVNAQDTSEATVFNKAVGYFDIGEYGIAEEEFGQFIGTFPDSPLLPEAILFQARSAIAQTNLADATTLLRDNVLEAGPLEDQYRYWLANAHMQNSNYLAAANSFVQITTLLTNSPLRLEASYGEALARFKLRDFQRVSELLQKPHGTFQQATKSRPNDDLALRGNLLLAESLFEQKKYRAAEQAAMSLVEENLTPDYRWDRQYLLCRIQVVDQRLPAALHHTTNLISIATATANRNLVADSVNLQADILRQLGHLEEAVQVYTNNLAETLPPATRRRALLNIIELKLTTGHIAEANEMLEIFFNNQPDEAMSDFALLTSGELQLTLHLNKPAVAGTNLLTSLPPLTNHLQEAMARFDRLLTTHTNSPLKGKALLNQGWCFWLANRIPESTAAFREAAEALEDLPFSEDLAVARFKLADALYMEGEYTNAVHAYQAITNDFAGVPRVKNTLFDQALYQIVRCQTELGNDSAAAKAMEQMLAAYPRSRFSARSVWLVGQKLIRTRQPAEARTIFLEFMKRFPDHSLLPSIELAVARTYAEEQRWDSALRQYESWLNRHPTHSLRPRTEFDLAWTTDQAGDDAKAFSLYTNFVAKFPKQVELAPLAQFLVGEKFLRQSNFVEALRSFQQIPENTNWPPSELTWRARLNAGRSAFAAQLWRDAAGERGHFTLLINDPDCPTNILAEALFAQGDTRIQEDANYESYREARGLFDKIRVTCPTSPLVPLALGRMGECSLQLASQTPKEYQNATNYFWMAIRHPEADLNARNLAESGLARTLEIQAGDAPQPEIRLLLNEAFKHYINIFMGDNLKENEARDPGWIERSGLAAAKLKEEQNQWDVAIEIYRKLYDALPPVRTRLQERIARAEEQLDSTKEN